MEDNRTRSRVGRLFRTTFVSFNWLMPALILALWVVTFWSAVSETQCEKSPFDLHRHSDICANLWPFILTVAGTAYLFLIWASGAAVLGFLSYVSRGRPTVS